MKLIAIIPAASGWTHVWKYEDTVCRDPIAARALEEDDDGHRHVVAMTPQGDELTPAYGGRLECTEDA